ncbi:hypothetical protein [Brucella thiophenivorans]|uniref:Uncharacterized protein n=1 Tax=Brucella thiophenivorans TaxID=571255 RepID=A0A256FZ02_9HYPH|nr:hypothetical protein [Brucella thiophenivorans]OYR20073.1 hypothetical protein CEV31_1496 [Brucella thiophenivorans]
MNQPAYDLEFGAMIRWLKQHELIMQSDLEGNAELSTRAERIGRKRRRKTEKADEQRHIEQ